MAGSVIEARNGNPETIRLRRASIFPIASFLRTERELGLTIPSFDLVCTPLWSPKTESYLLTQTVRRTDLTGIFPHLIGIAHDPEEALGYVMPIVTKTLKWLEAKGKAQYDDTINALLHDGRCSLDSLINLDSMWGNIVNEIKGLALEKGLIGDNDEMMSNEAWSFKTKNTEALNALKEKHSLKGLVNRQLETDWPGNLIDITEQLIVPVVSEENLAELLIILPDKFNRNIDTSADSLSLEEQILRKLGKVGNDYTRILIEIMKGKLTVQQLQEHYPC